MPKNQETNIDNLIEKVIEKSARVNIGIEKTQEIIDSAITHLKKSIEHCANARKIIIFIK